MAQPSVCQKPFFTDTSDAQTPCCALSKQPCIIRPLHRHVERQACTLNSNPKTLNLNAAAQAKHINDQACVMWQVTDQSQLPRLHRMRQGLPSLQSGGSCLPGQSPRVFTPAPQQAALQVLPSDHHLSCDVDIFIFFPFQF